MKLDKSQIDKCFEYSSKGYTTTQIFEALAISKSSLYSNKDALDAINRGRQELRQKLSDSLISNAVDMKNPTVQIFLAKRLRLFDDTFETITLNKSSDAVAATAQIYKAIADGTISDDKANQLKALLDTFVKAYEVQEIEKRLQALERGNTAENQEVEIL